MSNKTIRIRRPEIALDSTGTCTELPIGGHLKTDSVFPVKKGAKIFVNCVEGFTLTSGDRTITCVQDADYISSNQLPTCIIGKNLFFKRSNSY